MNILRGTSDASTRRDAVDDFTGGIEFAIIGATLFAERLLDENGRPRGWLFLWSAVALAVFVSFWIRRSMLRRIGSEGRAPKRFPPTGVLAFFVCVSAVAVILTGLFAGWSAGVMLAFALVFLARGILWRTPHNVYLALWALLAGVWVYYRGGNAAQQASAFLILVGSAMAALSLVRFRVNFAITRNHSVQEKLPG